MSPRPTQERSHVGARFIAPVPRNAPAPLTRREVLAGMAGGLCGGSAPDRDIAAELHGYLRGGARDGKFSGAVLLAQSGRPLFRRAYGLADRAAPRRNRPETRFLLFSASKQFTAAAVLRLHDAGKLSLADSVRKTLPHAPPEWEPVTLSSLLSHTSGIDFDLLYFWLAENYPELRDTSAGELPRFARRPLDTPPGETFRYSNAGYMLLSRVVEKVSGKKHAEFLRDAVFRPLGMRDTDATPDPPPARRARGYAADGTGDAPSEQPTRFIVGAGDVVSTVDDLLRWDNALYGDRFLKPATRDAMFRPHVRGRRGGFGYAWFLREAGGVRYSTHNGSGAGFNADVYRIPEHKTYLAVLCNRDGGADFPYPSGCLERVVGWLKAGHARPGETAPPPARQGF